VFINLACTARAIRVFGDCTGDFAQVDNMVKTASSRSFASARSRARVKTHRATRYRMCVVAAAGGPSLMVNSCAGKMGHAAAEAVLRAGLELVPFTFCGDDVSVDSIDVSGTAAQTVLPDRRSMVRPMPASSFCEVPAAGLQLFMLFVRPGHNVLGAIAELF
jgi:hypothetical protein